MAILALLFAWIAGPTAQAVAQQEFLSIAPVRYMAGFSHAPDVSTSVFLAGFERAIPVTNLLPQVSPESFVEFIRFQAGARIDEEQSVDLRLRLTAVSLAIQKQPWSASFSFLDINASGLPDVSADWLSLGIGPGFDVGSRDIRFVAKVLGQGAINSSRFGERSFPEIGSPAGQMRHTVSYGAEGTAGIVSPNRVGLLVRYSLSRYAIDAGIEKRFVEATLTLNASRKVQFIGSYRTFRIQISDTDDEVGIWGFGVRFTPEETY